MNPAHPPMIQLPSALQVAVWVPPVEQALVITPPFVAPEALQVPSAVQTLAGHSPMIQLPSALQVAV